MYYLYPHATVSEAIRGDMTVMLGYVVAIRTSGVTVNDINSSLLLLMKRK